MWGVRFQERSHEPAEAPAVGLAHGERSEWVSVGMVVGGMGVGRDHLATHADAEGPVPGGVSPGEAKKGIW